jgi:hypothetical protein
MKLESIYEIESNMLHQAFSFSKADSIILSLLSFLILVKILVQQEFRWPCYPNQPKNVSSDVFCFLMVTLFMLTAYWCN